MIFCLLLCLASCAENDRADTTTQTTETTSCSCPCTENTSTTGAFSTISDGTGTASGYDGPVKETPPITYEVYFVEKDGTKTMPHEALMFVTDIVIDEDGKHSIRNGDGPLAFMSPQSYLPQAAGKIPFVRLDESTTLEITAREGVLFEEVKTVDVYGMDFELLQENEYLRSIYETGMERWAGEEVYLYFEISFYDNDAPYPKSRTIGCFVKTAFPEGALP